MQTDAGHFSSARQSRRVHPLSQRRQYGWWINGLNRRFSWQGRLGQQWRRQSGKDHVDWRHANESGADIKDGLAICIGYVPGRKNLAWDQIYRTQIQTFSALGSSLLSYIIVEGWRNSRLRQLQQTTLCGHEVMYR